MRRVEAILAAALAVSLTSCILRGKQQTAKVVPPPPKPVVPAAPPPPPPNLSVPQTEAQLPPPQPVNPEALAQIPAPEEVPPTAPVTTRPRRTTPPASKPPTEQPLQGPVAPAAPPQPAEEDRPILQELVPSPELDRYQRETGEYKKEVQFLLQQAHARRLNSAQRALVSTINNFMKGSDAAAQHNDWRMAHELANRAVTLARELTGGK
jgi:hypothetical protein